MGGSAFYQHKVEIVSISLEIAQVDMLCQQNLISPID